ncbi:Imm26 family immunity protein [Pseudomonas sp.]|uniref:Imm26 family immunity protein n=1 Tax=Pseudomonas sp. TaxID=306 RepID=UPI0028B04147|nr:Imm26 family immunity protein [Pseudomonas sp.]
MKGVESMQAGDFFSIPMEDGRFAIGQIIWLGIDSKEQKFKKIFAFAVLSVGTDEIVSEGEEYLVFKDHRGDFRVMFTAVDKLKTGEWPIIKRGVVSDPSLKDLEFNMAGTLYRRGVPVRVLAIDEYQNHMLMGVSGFALIERFLQQY